MKLRLGLLLDQKTRVLAKESNSLTQKPLFSAAWNVLLEFQPFPLLHDIIVISHGADQS